jgi:Tat protein translocase TatB subunit
MGEFSFAELVLIVIIAIVIYGKNLPQAARKLAMMYNKLRRQISDIKDEIQRQIPMDEIKNELNKVGDLSADLMGPQTEIPYPPSSVMTQVADADKVLVTWNSVPGATTYNVKRSTGSTEPLLIIAMGLTDLSYTDSGLEPGKTYHYSISAQNSAGESGASEDSVVTLASEAGGTAPAPPPPEAPPAEAAPAPGPVAESTPAPGGTSPPDPKASGNGGDNGTGHGSTQESVAKSDTPPAD